MGQTTQPMSPAWFPSTRRRPDATVQLFFFPFAGGGASAYTRWHDLLPDCIESWPLEYPGHESRFREPLAPSINDLARLISAQIAALVRGRFALFGHSMGSAIAFETVKRLKKDFDLEPEILFVSGYSAPHLPPFRPPVRNLPEAEFRDELKLYGGTPAEILADEDFMQFISPLLRHDLGMCETHEHRPDAPVAVPIVAFGGYNDPTVPWDRLLEWSRLTTSTCVAHFFPGEHFFIKEAAPRITRVIAEALGAVAPGGELPAPSGDTVHLWLMATNISGAEIDRLSALLNESERVRAGKFVRHSDRARSIIGRAALRDLLGRYTERAPETLKIGASPTEKPLCDEVGPLAFNVSHSGNVALIGFAQGQAIGVDVEQVRAGVYEQGLAREVMTMREQATLEAHGSSDRAAAFFDFWVRKEAVLKRNGDGFTGSAAVVETGFSPRFRGAAVRATTSSDTICSFTLGDRHAAAVATDRPIAHVVVRSWR